MNTTPRTVITLDKRDDEWSRDTFVVYGSLSEMTAAFRVAQRDGTKSLEVKSVVSDLPITINTDHIIFMREAQVNE